MDAGIGVAVCLDGGASGLLPVRALTQQGATLRTTAPLRDDALYTFVIDASDRAPDARRARVAWQRGQGAAYDVGIEFVDHRPTDGSGPL